MKSFIVILFLACSVCNSAFAAYLLTSDETSSPPKNYIVKFDGESNCEITVKLPLPWFKVVDYANGEMDGYDGVIWVHGVENRGVHDMSVTITHADPPAPKGFFELHYKCKDYYKDTYMLFPINPPRLK